MIVSVFKVNYHIFERCSRNYVSLLSVFGHTYVIVRIIKMLNNCFINSYNYGMKIAF